jgi:hypothetical protein
MVGIIALTNVVSVISVGDELDVKPISRPILHANVPLEVDMNDETIPIPKLMPNNFLANRTRVYILKWILTMRSTAFAIFSNVNMILQCTRDIKKFKNEYNMNDVSNMLSIAITMTDPSSPSPYYYV